MVCHEIKSWTLSGLVGAFLDLSIAYLVLCASSLAYFASKFLGLFGLSLPCPCNGLFGDPNSSNCWQRVLVHCPSEKISSVQFSVKTKFPFDSIWDKSLNLESNANVMKEGNFESGCVGLDGEASESCSSFRDRSELGVQSGVMYDGDVKPERFDVKGKGVSNQKVRHALRRRKRGSTDNGRKSSSVSLYDPFQSDTQVFPQTPASLSKMVNESHEGSMVSHSSGGDALNYGKDSSKDKDVLGCKSPDFELNAPVIENKTIEKDALPDDDLKLNEQEELSHGSDETNAIRILEQSVEEERAARAALYLELEKERNAAATAADEAMAMILRLQEEKASIEMEARQYQRMIEEKSAYDFEEMNILKEILLRREREKHFLEKEVEMYRQMIFGSEQLDSDVQDTRTSHGKTASSLLYSGEDPVLMLQRIGESIHGKEKVENAKKFAEYDVRSINSPDHTLAFGKELPISELEEFDSLKPGCIAEHPTNFNPNLSSGNVDKFEQMEPLFLKKNPFSEERDVQRQEIYPQFNLSTADGYNLPEKTIVTEGEAQLQGDVISTSQLFSSKTIQTYHDIVNIFPYNCDDSENSDKDSCNAMSKMDPCVDVHVIDKKLNMCGEVGENGNEKLSSNGALDIPRSCDSPNMSRLQTEKDISRSCSDITSGLPPIDCSLRKPLLSNFRRNSMSAVDYERFKIENEVGKLRERLRIVQEGRGKLNISMEHREKEKIQLRLLENIMGQLREVQQLTESGKAVRQISLPPRSFEITSKKRRWRSASLEVTRST